MKKILIGGSPCTHWSVCRPNDREVESSGIGWELFRNYAIAKEMFEPDIFLYENVTSMSKDIRDAIIQVFRRNPYNINGGLVSAAERDRLFWSNIEGVEQPKERGIVLGDILEGNVAEKYFYKCDYDFHGYDKAVCATLHIEGNDILKRVNNPKFKCHTLTTCGGGNTQKKVLIDSRVRKLTPVEYERCMTLPDGYTKAVADTHRYTGCGNGWTAEVIIHILKYMNIPTDEEIQVLSMYDGIGTGRYCFDKMGYKNVKYVSYEIDKYAMKVANSNYPDIIQKGDAFQVRNDNWEYGCQAT